MQFLKTIDGHSIPECHVVHIGPRKEVSDVEDDDGCDVTVPFHRVMTTATLDDERREGGNRYYIASAREVARFMKACEAPNAPKQRNLEDEFKEGVQQLLELGLVERLPDGKFRMTEKGRLRAAAEKVPA